MNVCRGHRILLCCMLSVALLTVGCADSSTTGDRDEQVARSTTSTDSDSSPTTSAGGQTIDCTGDGSCEELVVEGDAPASLPSGAPSPLRGYADPSIRRDPDSGVLWMAYSWPSIRIESSGERTTHVESHLAKSEDDGSTWQMAGPMWTARPVTDPGSGEAGWIDHEVPDLLPVTIDGETRWIAARLDLFVPSGKGLGSRPPSGFRIGVLTADTPQELATAEPAVLGSAATDERWGVDADLTSLSQELTRCTIWNEPALHFDGSELFLALRCLPLTGSGGPDVAGSSIEVFSAEPEGEPSGWTWRYRGRLAGHDEATELGGDGLTQQHFALAVDGTLVVLLTPDSWNVDEREFSHHGVRAVEVDSLEEPHLAREGGELVVRATVTASDLEPLGPGAAAYEPTTDIGVVLVRRQIGDAMLVVSLHDTGLHL